MHSKDIARIKRVVSMLISVILTFSCFTLLISCGEDPPPPDNNTPPTPPTVAGETVYILKDKKIEHSIVYSKGSDTVPSHHNLATEFRSKVNMKYKAKPEPEFYEYTSKPASGKEILLGATDRPLSAQLKAEVDNKGEGVFWAYAYKDGNLAYYANSEAAIELSWQVFLDLIMKEKTIEVMSDLMVVDGMTTAQYNDYLAEKENAAAPDSVVMMIKDGRKSIVTIVHDDGNLPTVQYMASEFEKNNLKGTMALVAENINDGNKAGFQAVLDGGRFNVASHSYTHKYMGANNSEHKVWMDSRVDAPYELTIPAGHLQNEIVGSRDHLREMFPNEKVLCFVKPGTEYPSAYGQISAAAKAMIESTYISMRNTWDRADTIPPKDWYSLNSLMVQADSANPNSANNHTAAYWTETVDKTVKDNGWLIFLFHAIAPDSENPTGLTVSQSRTSIFFDALGERVESGDVWCAYLDEATMYIKEAQTAKVTLDKSVSGKITMTVTDEMDNEIYNYPITVKVKVPAAWEYVTVTQNGKTETAKTFKEGNITYVYANAVPDAGEAVLAPASELEYPESIKIGGTALEGFEKTTYYYNIELPAGTNAAPEVTVDFGGTSEVEQATLKNGEGSAKVKATVNGTEITYEIHFSVSKAGTGPIVIVKFDDLREGAVIRQAMLNACGYLNERGIKANVGVITSSLAAENAGYYNDIKTLASADNEIWNHGQWHDMSGNTPEFTAAVSYEKQMEYLMYGQNILLEKCGVQMTSFGAPGNATSPTTAQAVSDAGLKTVYFCTGNPEGVVNFNSTHCVKFEQETTVGGQWAVKLDYDEFVKSYTSKKNLDYIILQTHPKTYAADKKANEYKVFCDQIDYLIMNGARFMTASEYADYINAK